MKIDQYKDGSYLKHIYGVRWTHFLSLLIVFV